MFDVCIIGGGPAGSAAAISCVRRNLSVLLIEGSAFPRKAPGETLHPGIEPLLAQLGVARAVNDAGFLRHEGIHVERGNNREYQPYGRDSHGSWHGYQAWRATFDEILLRHAQQEGATVWQPCIARTPLTENGRVCGVSTSRGDVAARFVLDATGPRAWLGNRLQLAQWRCTDRLIAHYGYARAEGSPLLPQSPLLRRESSGWTWIARITPDLYHWTVLSRDSKRAASPAELGDALPVGRVRSADVTWREYLEPAGPGYFLLGDAAAVLDPLSSHGVLKAVMSGMFCGHLIGNRQSVDHYTGWIRDWFKHDVSRLAEFHSQTYAKA